MRTIIRTAYLIIIAFGFLFSACTHNNGDIGPLFGQWKLVEITVGDDVIYDSGNIYWAFQSSTLRMVKVREHNNYDEIYCNWQMGNNNQIIISFDDETYSPFPILGLEKKATLNINKSDGSEMTLSYLPENGVEKIYKFKKW